MRRLMMIGMLGAAWTWQSPAQAAELFQWVTQALQRIEARWGYRTFSQSLAWNILAVNRGNYAWRNFTAPNGDMITAIAACDNDCTRMRVTITDHQGRQVAGEDGYGGVAEARFYPVSGQTYRINAQPLDCTTAICYVVYNVVR